MVRIYVASSWRNPHYEAVCRALTEAGHRVLDWRAGEQPLSSWRVADERFAVATETNSWTPALAMDALSHERVLATYRKDMDLLNDADALVLLTPCGRSAHLEAGIAVGRGLPCALLLSDGVEPEVMTLGLVPCPVIAAVLQWLEVVSQFVPRRTELSRVER